MGPETMRSVAVEMASMGFVEKLRTLISRVDSEELGRARSLWIQLLEGASRMGHHETVYYLLSKNIALKKDIIQPLLYRSDMEPALLCASSRGHLKVVRALLAAGANPNTQDTYGNSPLMLAVQNNKKSVIDYLLALQTTDLNQTNHNGERPIFRAVLRGYVQTVDRLLRARAQVHHLYRYGSCTDNSTILHVAIRNYNVYPGMVSLLLSNKSVVSELLDLRDASWNRPIDLALRAGLRSCVELLLKAGVDPNERDKRSMEHSEYLLSRAVSNIYPKSLQMMQLLCDYGADVNRSLDVFEETPIFEAVRTLNIDALRMLIQYGADCSFVSNGGNSALHRVAESPDNKPLVFDILLILLQNGANLFAPMLTGPMYCNATYFTEQTRLSACSGVDACAVALVQGYYNNFRVLLEAGSQMCGFKRTFVRSKIIPQIGQSRFSKQSIWIRWTMSNPRTLKNIACTTIRCQLGEHLSSKVDKLPLPSVLKQMLLFSHLRPLRELYGRSDSEDMWSVLNV